MRILQINTSVNTGSTGRIAEEIGNRFLENNHSSMIAYGRRSPESNSETIRIGSDWSIILHGLKTRITDKHGFGSTMATKHAISKIRKYEPELIILHNLHGYFLNVRILFNYLREIDIPIIWILYDCWAFTGHCSYYDNANCQKWKKLCYSCPLKSDYPKSILLDNSKRNFRNKMRIFTLPRKMVLVSHSNWLARQIKASFLKTYQVKTIHNGVDIEKFQILPDEKLPKGSIQSQDFIILGVASIWSKRKGFNDFLKLSRLIGENMKIILVGLEEKSLKGLPKNIIALSRTENIEQLAKLYSRADVYVNPTRQDNFPTTNLEALACGTPVITYNTGGSPEAIDSKTGFVIEKGNIQGIIDAIEIVSSKGKNHYANACRSRAVSLFNKDDRYLDYLSLYEEMFKK